MNNFDKIQNVNKFFLRNENNIIINIVLHTSYTLNGKLTFEGYIVSMDLFHNNINIIYLVIGLFSGFMGLPLFQRRK